MQGYDFIELAVLPMLVMMAIHQFFSVLLRCDAQADAIVEAWFAGEGMGQALAHILFGLVNPSGKIAATIPVKLSDTSAYLAFPSNKVDLYYNECIYVGYRYYDKKEIAPRYPFGFGLLYTQFEYRAATLSSG